MQAGANRQEQKFCVVELDHGCLLKNNVASRDRFAVYLHVKEIAC